MRKHGRKGTLDTVENRFWIRREAAERRHTSLSFEADRCCWTTDGGRPRIIKH